MTTADWINFSIAVVTALSAFASLAVVWLTLQVLKANRAAVDVMRAQLDATTRPYILVSPSVRPMTTLLQLTVTNTGSSAAEDLELTLDKDYFFNAEEGVANNLRSYPAFSQRIDSFPPKAELVYSLGVGHKVMGSELCPQQFTVTATYSWAGQRCTEHTRVDLKPYGLSGKPIDVVAERLDRLIDVIKVAGKKLNQ